MTSTQKEKLMQPGKGVVMPGKIAMRAAFSHRRRGSKPIRPDRPIHAAASPLHSTVPPVHGTSSASQVVQKLDFSHTTTCHAIPTPSCPTPTAVDPVGCTLVAKRTNNPPTVQPTSTPVACPPRTTADAVGCTPIVQPTSNPPAVQCTSTRPPSPTPFAADPVGCTPTIQPISNPLAENTLSPLVQPNHSIPVRATPPLVNDFNSDDDDYILDVDSDEYQEDNTIDLVDYECDTDGKVIIHVDGKFWTPNAPPVAAIGHAIKSQFRGPYFNYQCLSEDMKEKWWNEFKQRITWDPAIEYKVEKVYKRQVKKRLRDFLSKVRAKGKRPYWISQEAWAGLVAYWGSAAFKKKYDQNKSNRASKKGGAVHITGSKAHHEIALALTHKFRRPVQPDELFLATHKRVDGDWVEQRAKTTYNEYHEQLYDARCSRNVVIDDSLKLKLWTNAAGGKSRGRCYGTGQLACNIRPGSKSLTHGKKTTIVNNSVDNEDLQQQVQQAKHEAATAKDEAVAAKNEAAAAKAGLEEANNRCAQLEEHMRRMDQKFQLMMDRQSGVGLTIVSQVHPDYNEDWDEQLVTAKRCPSLKRRRH